MTVKGRKTATYKIIKKEYGNIYQFYCDISGALVKETIPYKRKEPEEELEAAKRYNATIELSAMHNEQHANYIANEQNKEIDTVTPIETPIEPEAVTPVIPEPTVAPITSPTDIETNWFDMPVA